MPDGFRLGAYLARIGIAGTARPDWSTLTAIHAAHVEAIPFEGLDPLLGRPVPLDLPSLQAKLVDMRRGGFCFEQNGLLIAALEAIGFQVTGLTGRVRWMSPPDGPLGPRTHMTLKVDLPDGPYLADVGFGACLLDAPLLLRTDIEQRTAMGVYRLTERGGQYQLSAERPGGWRTMYVFDLAPQMASDYELGSWFAATSPRAPFSSTLIMERLSRDRRYKLMNTRLTVEARDGEVISERVLREPAELEQVLDETFRIAAPAPADQIFARIAG